MKIGQPSDNPISVNTTAPAVPSKGGQSAISTANVAAAKSTQSAGVAVTVSTLARSLGAAKSGDTADVDMEKVKSVRAAIQQGTYVVDAEAIADKLLANAQELVDRNRS
ncbi:flagellar biosynthesis anti-sigma factor FlgM [Rhodoferax ferrireducens]|uniref:flagellar biosynthesis anti-sigma factor FlgM n=1 Tax=Rhodoferax ferrireducens TaxID=192843 RepID=UPI000E0D4A4F|nr:flagellar biosynthesis anti-sigma factor FlgM [Rhodoferax ferrireducens]